MSIKLTALCLLLGVAGSFASSSSSSSSSSGSSGSCSAPPASLEVCLSSVFGTLESALVSISASLKKHEITMHSELREQFQVLSSEVTGIKNVYKVASSVRSVVDSDYSALDEQIEALSEEKYHLHYLLSKFVAQLDLLMEEKKSVSDEIQIVYEEFASAKKANWNINKQMSAVGKAKAVIVKQEADAQAVINELAAEITKIKGKVGQMNKRQDWLLSWQEKLSEDLSEFVSDVKDFKSLESDLAERIKHLKIEQASLLADAQSIEANMASLSEHYQRVAEYLSELDEYESQLEIVRKNVDNQETLFSYAASDFSCEAELLKAEACNSTPAKPAAKPAAVAAATGAKAAAAATAAKPAAAAAKPAATAAKAAV